MTLGDSGLVVRVLHPDFVDNDDEQRQGFIDGVRRSWTQVLDAEGLGLGESEWGLAAREREKAVEVFIPYSRGIRRAEMEAATFIAAGSVYVASINREVEASGDIMPAYSYVIERDVGFAAFEQRPGPKPKSAEGEAVHEVQA